MELFNSPDRFTIYMVKELLYKQLTRNAVRMMDSTTWLLKSGVYADPCFSSTYVTSLIIQWKSTLN